MSEEWKIAYAAGLFDGEGSLNIYETATRSAGYRGKPTIRIAMTNKEAIEFFRDVLEIDNQITVVPPQKEGYSQQYKIKLTHQKAKRVLLLLLPYLIIKKEAAVKILTDYYGEPN
jgi:hypothetical protein